MAPARHDAEGNPISFFSHQHKILSIKSDISRWDGAWEISACEDVFPLLEPGIERPQ